MLWRGRGWQCPNSTTSTPACKNLRLYTSRVRSHRRCTGLNLDSKRHRSREQPLDTICKPHSPISPSPHFPHSITSLSPSLSRQLTLSVPHCLAFSLSHSLATSLPHLVISSLVMIVHDRSLSSLCRMYLSEVAEE